MATPSHPRRRGTSIAKKHRYRSEVSIARYLDNISPQKANREISEASEVRKHQHQSQSHPRGSAVSSNNLHARSASATKKCPGLKECRGLHSGRSLISQFCVREKTSEKVFSEIFFLDGIFSPRPFPRTGTFSNRNHPKKWRSNPHKASNLQEFSSSAIPTESTKPTASKCPGLKECRGPQQWPIK